LSISINCRQQAKWFSKCGCESPFVAGHNLPDLLGFSLCPLPKGAAYPAPSIAELAIAILYIPIMLTAGAIVVAGVASTFLGKNRRIWIFSIIMCLPACFSLGQTIVLIFPPSPRAMT